MYCNLYIYLAPYEYYNSSMGTRCYCVVWASATNAAAWLRYRTDYCAFRLERREPHGVPSPCGHNRMVCAIVCLTVMPSFSDLTNVQLSATVSRPTIAARLISRCAARRRHYRPIIKKVLDRQWKSNPQPSEVDKDLRLIQLSYHGL